MIHSILTFCDLPNILIYNMSIRRDLRVNMYYIIKMRNVIHLWWLEPIVMSLYFKGVMNLCTVQDTPWWSQGVDTGYSGDWINRMAEIWMDVKRSGLLLSSNLGCSGMKRFQWFALKGQLTAAERENRF